MSVKSMYPEGALLGPDISTGGPASRAMVQFSEEFECAMVDLAARYGLHDVLGCEIIDYPIDAPSWFPAGCSHMDWLPRGKVVYREPEQLLADLCESQ